MKASKYFRHVICMILLVLAFVPAISKSKSVKPTTHKKIVKLLVNNKSRTYYRLSKDTATVISIDGPGEMKFSTRELLTNQQVANYEILYTVDGESAKTIKANNKAIDEKASISANSSIKASKTKSHQLNLGSGYHTIKLKLKDSESEVIVRISFNPKKEKKDAWKETQPESKSEMITLITDDKPVPYHRFTKSNPLKITVSGPTQLRVLSRNENNFEMRGRLNYRISVKEDGKLLNTYLISTERSVATYYKDDETLMPGKAKDFIIKVPEGKHSYEIIPMDKSKNSLLGKLLLPTKSANKSRK